MVLDPAPARQLPSSILSHVNILKPNETEATVLSGVEVTSPETAITAAKALRAKIAQDRLSAVVITLGEQGVLLCTHEECTHIPAISVDVVDTTGAGDAFSGALATALAKGSELMNAVKYAAAAGAAATTVLGATPSMPTQKKIDAIQPKS